MWTGIESSTSPIDITSLGTTSQIRLVANLTYSGGSPKLLDWEVQWCTRPENIDLGIYLAGDPVAHYRFEEGSGASVYDASGNGNTGTISGSAGFSGYTPSVYPSYKSLRFDGVDDNVTIPDSPSLTFTGGITVAVWVRLDSSCTTDGTFCRIVNRDGEFILRKAGDGTNGFAFLIYNGTSWANTVYSTHKPVADVWYHVAATYDGSSLRLYINGTLNNSVAKTGNIPDTTNAISLGSTTGGLDRLSGYLDEVRIYTRVLSAEEVATLAGTPVPDGGRVYANMTAEFMVRVRDCGGTTNINYVDLRLDGTPSYVANWTESSD
ncbi:MAG: LamG domain-containing protein, partial [bacterium]